MEGETRLLNNQSSSKKATQTSNMLWQADKRMFKSDKHFKHKTYFEAV